VTYRNKRLTDLCHDCPCFVDEPHQCNDHQGSVPMHSDWSIFGRGGWHKAHDFAIAAGCPNAHALLTGHIGDDSEREHKRMVWLRAHVKTMEWMWTNGKVKVAA
jgi:hypothetical protein